MGFIDDVKRRAKGNKKNIVLPESLEERNLTAAAAILKEGVADITLIGDREKILAAAGKNDVSGAIFINPTSYDKIESLVDDFAEIRKDKGVTKDEARHVLTTDAMYLGIMLVKNGTADGMVSGAIHATADVLRPALQILKTAPDKKIVSSFFIMCVPDCEYGENGVFAFADCGLVQNPTSEKLAAIATDSAESFRRLIGAEPVVAMLSHSTKGSAKHDDVDKVVKAVELAKTAAPNLKLDGEFQLDAAIVPSIGALKAKGGDVAGKANVLVFPDLDAGNIGYKLVQRLAKAEAYGPITQGLAKPVNDLSRGCYAEDIVGIIAITALQAR
ncbi:MAG: phosphate acetyltransferase [Clostridiales bacterium]|jgi:phosphate acetyltransferase|nr:phosphate acetyltransferase [Clostridiales bacterium]